MTEFKCPSCGGSGWVPEFPEFLKPVFQELRFDSGTRYCKNCLAPEYLSTEQSKKYRAKILSVNYNIALIVTTSLLVNSFEEALKSATERIVKKVARVVESELNHSLYELSLKLPNKARNGLKNKLMDINLPDIGGKRKGDDSLRNDRSET